MKSTLNHGQDSLTGISRCLIYPTGYSRPLSIWVPIRQGSFEGPPFWSEDLNLDRWFPRGATRTTISSGRRATYRSQRLFDIFYSADSVSELPNQCIATKFNVNWMGNVVVVKRGLRDPMSICNITIGDHNLCSMLLGS